MNIAEKPPKRPSSSNRNSSMSSESSTSSLTNRLLPSKFQNLSMRQDNNFGNTSSSSSSNTVSASSSTSVFRGHAKKSSYELTKQVKNDLSNMIAENDLCSSQPLRVRIIRAHNNSIAVAYCNFVACYKMKENVDWQLFFTTPKMSSTISHISLISKFGNQPEKLAVALIDNSVHLWCFEEPQDDITRDLNVQKLGIFHLDAQIDKLFFIGNQLVALSRSGKVGIWHSMTQNWQRQDLIPISCYDTAGSVLLLGCTNGSIYYIDMQKFPLRMKDNDLLITELYRDPNSDCISAISVYLTPKTNLCGNWIEIAYGTNSGTVRVIVQHPETVGHGPQLFQTYTVHTSPVTRVALTTNHLISVCSEYNHVRSWTCTRFRGMISTQPGGTSIASFKVVTLDAVEDVLNCEGCEPGPYGDQDAEQLFIQRLVPDANMILVRLASNGDRICAIRSVDSSPITAFFAHECEVPNRMGARPRRYLLTGSIDGSVQLWDLTTALDQYNEKIRALSTFQGQISTSSSDKPSSSTSTSTPSTSSNTGALNSIRMNPNTRFTPILQGPTPEELLQMIEGCELCCASLSTTPTMTPQASAACLTNLERFGHCN
jgi:hypothetical protein